MEHQYIVPVRHTPNQFLFFDGTAANGTLHLAAFFNADTRAVHAPITVQWDNENPAEPLFMYAEQSTHGTHAMIIYEDTVSGLGFLTDYVFIHGAPSVDTYQTDLEYALRLPRGFFFVYRDFSTGFLRAQDNNNQMHQRYIELPENIDYRGEFSHIVNTPAQAEPLLPATIVRRAISQVAAEEPRNAALSGAFDVYKYFRLQGGTTVTTIRLDPRAIGMRTVALAPLRVLAVTILADTQPRYIFMLDVLEDWRKPQQVPSITIEFAADESESFKLASPTAEYHFLIRDIQQPPNSFRITPIRYRPPWSLTVHQDTIVTDPNPHPQFPTKVHNVQIALAGIDPPTFKVLFATGTNTVHITDRLPLQAVAHTADPPPQPPQTDPPPQTTLQGTFL